MQVIEMDLRCAKGEVSSAVVSKDSKLSAMEESALLVFHQIVISVETT